MKTIIKIYAVIAMCALGSFSNAALVELANYNFDDYSGTGSVYSSVDDFTYSKFSVPSSYYFSPTNGMFAIAGRLMQESATLELNSQLIFSLTATNLPQYASLQISEFTFDLSTADGGANSVVAELYVSTLSNFSTQHKIGVVTNSSTSVLVTETMDSTTGDFTSPGLTIKPGDTLYFRLYFTDGYRYNATSPRLEVDNVIIKGSIVYVPAVEAATYTFDDYTSTGSRYTSAGDFTYTQFNDTPAIGVFLPTNGTFKVSGRNMWESGTLELNSQLQFSVTVTNIQSYAPFVSLKISEFTFDMSAVDGVPTVGEVYVSSVSDFSTQHKIGEFSTSVNGSLTTGTLTPTTDDFTYAGLTMENGETLYFRIYFTDGYRNSATNAWLEVDNVIIKALLIFPPYSVIKFR